MTTETHPTDGDLPNVAASPFMDGLAPVKEDHEGEVAAEKKEEVAPGPVIANVGADVKQDAVPLANGHKEGHPDGVPQPQAPPVNKRPVPPPVGHYDLISELNPRCETHIPIPLKQYSDIPWRLVLCGSGPGPSPLTQIERETGAAVLVRTIQRTINRRPTVNIGSQTREQQITAELKRLEAALAAARKAEAAALSGEPASSPNISNIAVPPSPGGSEKNENPMNAAAVDLKLKAAELTGPKTVENATPEARSAELPKVEAIQKIEEIQQVNGLEVVIEGEGEPPTPGPAGRDAAMANAVDPTKLGDLGAQHPAQTKEKVLLPDPAVKQVEGAIGRVDDAAIPGPLESRADAPAKRAEPKAVKPEIGIHCWVIGSTREEVNDAAEATRALIDQAVKEYEDEFEDVSGDEQMSEIDEESEVVGNDGLVAAAQGNIMADERPIESGHAEEDVGNVEMMAVKV